MLLILSILSLIISLSHQNNEISCRDEKGQLIDWFSAYKLPKSAKSSNEFVKNGTAYAYITEPHQTWSLGSTPLGDAKSIAGQTLSILYSQQNITNQDEFGYFMYNDQIGSDSDNDDLITNSNRAHAKGVVIFNKKTALWLIHSIPNYPPKPSTGKYDLASSQTVYAQSMLCLTFPFTEIDLIGKQLLYSYPQIQDSFVPSSLLKLNNQTGKLNNLLSVIKGDHIKAAPYFSIQQLTTLKNNSFLAFHKDAKFGQDLYANLIGSHIKSSLFTETWSHGVGTMATDCNSTYPVYNIEKVSMSKLVANFSFVVGADHSKWAVNLAMKSSEAKYACIGDINRQNSQKKRGGGSVCFVDNKNVWKSYFDLIELTENCFNKNVPPGSL